MEGGVQNSRNKLSFKIKGIFEGAAEGPIAIAALCLLFFVVMFIAAQKVG